MNNTIRRNWNMFSMVQIEDLRGMTFQAEDKGHTFVITGLDENGDETPLSGTVAAVFLRADNTDVAISGTVSNGKAQVTLTDECYGYPGRFGLTIFLTEGGQKAAIYAAIGSVHRTSSGAVSPETAESVVDLINEIEAAIAQIPASYTEIMAAVAPTYSSNAVYAVGSLAWEEGVLYRCIVPITRGETWTAAHWEAASLAGDIVKTHDELDNVEASLLYEIVKSGRAYETSRMNNNRKISPSDGGPYESHTGCCMTNNLNGDAYPMDAVYIDSTDYCIRLFGYNTITVSTSSYAGCTDPVPGGEKNVLYRDKDWRMCRLVVYRNPPTQTTEFTEEEIADIASKIRILKYTDLQTELAYDKNAIATSAGYLFDNKMNYDEDRISNNYTIDTTTGATYEAHNGRCVTRALNGAAFPMDAVYIDSDSYSIRLFGYSASSTASSSYVGCTDYIAGGDENILYRPEEWPYCRMVIARNPTTNTTEFTDAEIADIASKLVIMKKTDDYTALGLHEVPKNTGVLNVIKRARQLTDIKWTSEVQIPRVTMIDGDNYSDNPYYVDDVFLADTEYTGVPYSSRGFVGHGVSISCFASATFNSQYSKMKDSVKVDRNTASMYGTVCVTLVSYALGIPIVTSTYYDQIPDLELIGTVPNTVNNVQLGDIVVVASHVAIITDIIRAGNVVKYIEVSESTKHGLENLNRQGKQWGGICRRKMWTADDYAEWFADFSLYRYKKIDEVTFTENRFVPIENEAPFPENPYMACMPYNGDCSWYSSTTSSVRIMILDNHFTSMVVELNGTEIGTYSITSETEYVDVPNSGGGYYKAKLKDGNNHVTRKCRWFINVNSNVTFTVSSGVAHFTQTRPIDNPPVYIRFGAENDSPYVHIVENLEKSYSNGTYTYTFDVPWDSGHSFTKFHVYNDAGRYGILGIQRSIS